MIYKFTAFIPWRAGSKTDMISEETELVKQQLLERRTRIDALDNLSKSQISVMDTLKTVKN
jgi:hypothetical protein